MFVSNLMYLIRISALGAVPPQKGGGGDISLIKFSIADFTVERT